VGKFELNTIVCLEKVMTSIRNSVLVLTDDLENRLSAIGSSTMSTAKDLGSRGWSALASFYESTVKTTSEMLAENSVATSSPQPPPYQVEEEPERIASRRADNGWGFDDSFPSKPTEVAAPSNYSRGPFKPTAAPSYSSTDPFDSWGFDEAAPQSIPAPKVISNTPEPSANSANEAKRSVAAPGKTTGARKVIVKGTRPNPNASKPPAKNKIDPFDEDWGWQ